MSGDIGKYLKFLIFTSLTYFFIVLVAGTGGSMNQSFQPPPEGIAIIGWFFSQAVGLLYSAFSLLTLAMLPLPLRIVLAPILLGLLIYSALGLFFHLARLVKPFGG